MKVAIVGGGIGGLTLAHCFQKSQIPFTLFERAAAFKEVGAGIGLSESTVLLLKRLGLEEQLLQHTYAVENAVVVDKAGREIRRLPVKNGGLNIHRHHLIEVLAAGINRDQVCLNANIGGFEITDGDQIRLDTGDGTSPAFAPAFAPAFDYVFACDGINSGFRKRLYPSLEKRYAGQTIGKVSHQPNGLSHWLTKSMFKLLPKPYFKKQYQDLIDLSYLNQIPDMMEPRVV